MDRYQRVEKTRAETAINENEIRITALGRMRNYISYATTLLQEKGSNEIIIKAMGRAISKTVMIAELIKRRIVGLHQVTTIESTDITDVWEPLEEGLLPLETIRRVSMITITLSKNELNTSSPGYQPPIPVDQVKPLIDADNEGERLPSGRGRGYGNRGRGYGDRGRGYGDRGRGRVGGISGMGITNREAGDGEDGGRGYGGRGSGPPGEDEGWDGGRGYSGRGRGPPGEDEGWDGGRGYGGRGRGRGRARGAIRGGRGYGDGNGGRYMRREQDEYDDCDPDFFPPQGRGRGRLGRGRGRGRGRASSRG